MSARWSTDDPPEHLKRFLEIAKADHWAAHHLLTEADQVVSSCPVGSPVYQYARVLRELAKHNLQRATARQQRIEEELGVELAPSPLRRALSFAIVAIVWIGLILFLALVALAVRLVPVVVGRVP